MALTAEAVEAATKAFRETHDMGDALMNALTAAAPFIAAQAWDEGWDAMADFDHRQAGPYPTNPYRSGT